MFAYLFKIKLKKKFKNENIQVRNSVSENTLGGQLR